MARVPAHIARRYLRGRCWPMAAALSSLTGLPLRGLRGQRGDIFHAFVADETAGVGYDIRGAFPLSRAAEGSADPKAAIVPLSLADIEKIDGVLQKPELSQARSIARTYKLAPTGAGDETPIVNTIVTYQYRDAGNNKVARRAVFPGGVNDALRAAILKGMASSDTEEGRFIPGQVGLPDLQMSFVPGPEPLRWYPDDDAWHELCSISETLAGPTEDRTIAEFAELVSRTEWDETYRPPFHAEMVANYENYVAMCDEDPSL